MMKKLFIISLILGGLFLTGCSQQKGLSQNELFEKKKECASYAEKIKQDNIKNNEIISDIFYSEERNSCLYVKNTNDIIELNDYLTNENILRFDNENRCEKITKDKKLLNECKSIYYKSLNTIKKLKKE